mmetsp:Transcript_8447/g.15917  ORF Transcript_8447/g.15917 Transcript_8447/m.15917 type:complete len:756 (-) Transcript_8447:231-2498(-)
MSTPPTSSSKPASPVENLDVLLNEIQQDQLEVDSLDGSSPHSSPSGETKQLSPCVVETIKRVNSLKIDFQADFQKIEKNIEKETKSSSPAPLGTSVQTPVAATAAANTTVDNRCTPEAVLEDTVTEAVTQKPTKIEKELFRDRVKPQRPVATNSRLLQGTRSNSAKRVMPASRERGEQKEQEAKTAKPRCASAGVRRRPTRPEAPTFMSRPSRPSDVKLTSEEMEFQKVEKEKKEAEKQMKSYQKTFQVLKTKGAIPTTVRSVKELTIPMTPSFPTDESKRKRVFPDEHKDEGKKAAAPKAPAGPTIPAPFQFATTRRNGEVEKSKDTVQTSGETMESFMKNTRSTYVPRKAATGITQAQAPTFRTEQRSNSVGRPKPMSREELEEKEMREAQAMTFKAKPVNKKIFDSMGVNGVPKVQVKEATTFAEFHLSSDDRAVYHKTHHPPEPASNSELNTSFKAREMPDFSKVSRPRTPTTKPKLTETNSPKLHGGVRSSSAPARRQKPSHEEVEKKRREDANAWKKNIKKRQELTNPVDVKLRTTERGSASQSALQDRIKRQMLEEKKATEVHATPFNEKIFKKGFSVSTSQKELTEFKEFHLHTDDRHNEAAMKSMEKMQEALKNKSEFHARPCPSTTFEPGFKPTPSEKEPVTPMNVHLKSEQRSLQRKSFDDAVTKSKQEEKDQKDRQKAAQQDKENFELNKLRRAPVSKGGMSFKASKVLSKDPYPVKAVMSTPLTEPKAPDLHTALRTRTLQK